MKRWIRQLHADNEGAIGVLVLLTVWCFVGLIALLWNTAEYSVQRQHVQNAVDAMSYSSSMWMVRTLNQITAQNMLISQDASADIIFRAAKDTEISIDTELQTELALITAIEKGQLQLSNRLTQLEFQIDQEAPLVNKTLYLLESEVSSGAIQFPDQEARIIYLNKIRQTIYALQWLQDNYVSQLKALAAQAKDAKLTLQMLEEAKETIGVADPNNIQLGQTEYQDWAAFCKQIASASPTTTEDMEKHEEDLFQDETELASTFQDKTVSQQADHISAFYNLAGTRQVDIPAPVYRAGEPERIPHVDMIRVNHPNLGRNPNVVLDPINPNTAYSDDPEEYDADIVYPPYPVDIDGKIFTIDSNTPHGWGHCWAFPIEQYLSGRVGSDMQLIRSEYMAPIDLLRQQLALRWANELGIQLNVPSMPTSIPDPVPDPVTNQPVMIPILPDLTATEESGQKTGADFVYRRESALIFKRHAAVRECAEKLSGHAEPFYRAVCGSGLEQKRCG